jgi:Na+/melibiose symporter-like transporter
MEKPNSRWVALSGGIVVLFIATVVILMKIIPEPHQKLDYLVIGAVATFLSMILLWVAMINAPKE